jgi:TusA-related sulfurtransferase
VSGSGSLSGGVPPSSDDASPELELDCRGMRCPLPVIELGRHIEDVEVGQVIGVATADVAARVDVPAWCRMREQEYVGESLAEDGTPLFLVRRLR